MKEHKTKAQTGPMKAISVRMSERQKELWTQEFHEGGYASLAEFIRVSVDRSLQKGIVSPNEIESMDDTLSSLRTELNHIGNNINQLTRHAHSTGQIQNTLNEQLSELDDIKADLRDILAVLHSSRFKKLGKRNDH